MQRNKSEILRIPIRKNYCNLLTPTRHSCKTWPDKEPEHVFFVITRKAFRDKIQTLCGIRRMKNLTDRPRSRNVCLTSIDTYEWQGCGPLFEWRHFSALALISTIFFYLTETFLRGFFKRSARFCPFNLVKV